MRRKFIVFPLFAGLLLLVAFGTGARCIMATATQVTDGDTFDATANDAFGWGGDCPVTDGQQYHVRLINVDAPTGDECYAQEAKDYLTNLIEGKRVCLARDVGCRDSSGNILAYVGVSQDPAGMGCDTFVNAEMIRNGYARTATTGSPAALRWLLNFLQCQAYRQQAGMWGACPDLAPPPNCPGAPIATGTPKAHPTRTWGKTKTPEPATATPAP